jgi:hypothetical protein
MGRQQVHNNKKIGGEEFWNAAINKKEELGRWP